LVLKVYILLLKVIAGSLSWSRVAVIAPIPDDRLFCFLLDNIISKRGLVYLYFFRAVSLHSLFISLGLYQCVAEFVHPFSWEILTDGYDIRI
jgi:hypothetical protein